MENTPTEKRAAIAQKRLVRPLPFRGINNGFWDRDPSDRAARMESACDRAGVSNFFDLSPEDHGNSVSLPAAKRWITRTIRETREKITRRATA